MKKLLGLLTIAVLAGSMLTGCSPSSDTIKIGVNLELTGPVSVYGIPERKGMELALEEINAAGGVLGKDLEFVFYDNAYDTAKAVENAIRFATQDGVVAMLGPATSAPSLAVGPIAKQYEVVNFTPSATNAMVTMDGTQVNPWVFRGCFLDPFQGLVLANFAVTELEATRAVVMYSSSSDYSTGLAESFQDQFVKNGGTVVNVSTYVDEDTDFNAILTTIAALDFDVLVVTDYAERGGLIYNQARSTGITVPVLGPDGFDTPDFNDLAGGAANVNDVYFVNHFSTLLEEAHVVKFINAYTAKFNEAPNALSALAYDSVYVLAAAIEAAGSEDTKAIRDALAATQAYVGVTGTITFNELNNPVKSAVVIKLTNGQQSSAVIVEP